MLTPAGSMSVLLLTGSSLEENRVVTHNVLLGRSASTVRPSMCSPRLLNGWSGKDSHASRGEKGGRVGLPEAKWIDDIINASSVTRNHRDFSRERHVQTYATTMDDETLVRSTCA